MDYTRYDEIVSRHTTVFLVLLGMLFVVCAVGIVLAIVWLRNSDHRSKDERISDRIMLIVFSISILMPLVLFPLTIHAKQYDIQNQAYLTYEGEFEVVRVKAGANIFIYNEKGRKIQLDKNSCNLEEGTYMGSVVYSQKTRIAFELDVYERIE